METLLKPCGRIGFAARFVWLLLALPVTAPLRAQPQPNRIAGRLDPSRMVPITGNIHPKARPEYDRGPVAGDLALEYVTLYLKPAPAQQADLDRFLTDVQTPGSPVYRKWLTPEQYADRFGATPADISQITDWLKGQGLTIVSTARGRNFVVFKGTADKVQTALRVEIHRFVVDGETHFANATEPSVPAAIAPFTLGFAGLDDFKLKPSPHATAPVAKALYENQHVLAPRDLWDIYDISPFYTAGISGDGMKLAVIGQANVNLADIAAYQSDVALTANLPVKMLVPGITTPGISADSNESDLDLELTGAIAPNAQILFVYSNSVQNSVTYAIDQAVAPVISYSYAGCELGSSGSVASLYRQLAQQANAEGITWLAAAGDSGAAGCDAGAKIAVNGLSAMLPASIPEITGVGGTEFNEGSSSYWGPSNLTAPAYIPEVVWNDTGEVGILAAGGGGASLFFSRPAWQLAAGMPSTNSVPGRLIPDLALSASAQHDPYFAVESGSGGAFGGTSAATPVFAGIMLLIAEASGPTGLGNINPALYRLASNSANVCSSAAVTSTCVFHDIIVGNNLVPCTNGTNGCNGGYLGYDAAPGYDMASGLGSVDATNLALAMGTQPSGPVISSVSTAYGSTAIAENTFIVIKGTNLVPASTPATGVNWSSAPSFASGQMPTEINGVSVTVNGQPAFVYFFCSAATDSSCTQDQLNVLTPLDGTTGSVQVVVTSGGVASPPFTATMQAVAPSFLLFSSAGYIAATHANGGLIGPTGLYPGYSTPASRGEEIALYAVGFGLPSSALANGSSSQSGSLPVVPVCNVEGIPASVAYAGLISPGLYQLNLTIPQSATVGNDSVSCIYDGATTPAGDLITVQ